MYEIEECETCQNSTNFKRGMYCSALSTYILNYKAYPGPCTEFTVRTPQDGDREQEAKVMKLQIRIAGMVIEGQVVKIQHWQGKRLIPCSRTYLDVRYPDNPGTLKMEIPYSPHINLPLTNLPLSDIWDLL